MATAKKKTAAGEKHTPLRGHPLCERGLKTGAQTVDESAYTAKELAAASRARLGVSPEVVFAALRLAKKDTATLTEARSLVKAFMQRKVK